MTEDMGIRGQATGGDLLAAVKLAVASQDMASKERAFDVIAWIMELHEPSGAKPVSVDVFVEAIKQTKRPPAPPRPATFMQQGGGTSIQPGRRLPENLCSAAAPAENER